MSVRSAGTGGMTERNADAGGTRAPSAAADVREAR